MLVAAVNNPWASDVFPLPSMIQDHLRENVRTHSFKLTAAEKEAIDAVVAKRQGPKGDVWDIERSSLP